MQFFGTKSNLYKHVRIVHESKKPYQCQICQKAFGQKHTLQNHIVSVHKEKESFKSTK